MKTGWTIGPGAWGKAALCLWLAGACGASGGEARRHFAEAEALHERGENAAAAEAFLRAAEAAEREDEGLDGDVARFNALAAGADSLPDEALGGGDKSADLELRAALHYNRGAAWMAKANAAAEEAGAAGGVLAALPGVGGGGEPAADAMEGEPEKALVEKAVKEYREAVLLAPGVTEYQQNYELSQTRLQELQQQEQQQQDENQDGEDQDQQQQQEQDQQQDGQDGQQQDGQDPQEQQQEEQQQEQQQGEGSEGEEQESGQEAPAEASPAEAGERMTEEEAARLLDAMRDREQQLRDALQLQLGRPVPVEKDW